MEKFFGVIVKESLENESVLKKLKILNIEVEQVTQDHKTPWIKQWTLYTIEVLENQSEEVSLEIAQSLDINHSRYADFENKYFHYIVFRNKVFKVDKSKPNQYNEVFDYSLSLGIPDYQLDFI